MTEENILFKLKDLYLRGYMVKGNCNNEIYLFYSKSANTLGCIKAYCYCSTYGDDNWEFTDLNVDNIPYLDDSYKVIGEYVESVEDLSDTNAFVYKIKTKTRILKFEHDFCGYYPESLWEVI